MSDFRLAFAYLRARLLITILIVVSIALGVGLATLVLTLARRTTETLSSETARWDIIVGAKGSPLQLVLNGLYYLDAPTGNINVDLWKQLRDDPAVATLIPLNMGDNYFGWPIVGTVPEFFATRHAPLAQGKLFSKPFELVAGAEVTARQHLHLGQQVIGAHGWSRSDDLHPKFPYTVVGILKPSGSSSDRAVYTDYHSSWIVHAHPDADEAPVPGHDPTHEVTMLLVRLHQPGARFQLTQAINTREMAQAVIPVNEISRLQMMFIDPLRKVLLIVAYLVVVVSSLSVLISLYMSIHQRQRDIAVLRSLGATATDVFRLVTVEAAVLSGLGVLAGWFIGRVLLYAGSLWCQAHYGISLAGVAIQPAEVTMVVSIWALGILSGVLPAAIAYRLPVADILVKE